MSVQVILWVLGIAVTVLVGLFGFLANWVKDIDRKQSAQAQHFAENYVRGHEIQEVKRVVENLRSEMSVAVAELRTEMTHQVGELTKAVWQLVGQNK